MENETTAQMLQLVDDYDAQGDILARLRAAAREVVAEQGTDTAALRRLDDAVRSAYPESEGDPVTVVPKQTDPLTQWVKVGSTWERSHRRPLLDATVYPLAAGAHWRIHRVDAGPRDYLRTGDAPSIEAAKAAATAALVEIAGATE